MGETWPKLRFVFLWCPLCHEFDWLWVPPDQATHPRPVCVCSSSGGRIRFAGELVDLAPVQFVEP